LVAGSLGCRLGTFQEPGGQQPDCECRGVNQRRLPSGQVLDVAADGGQVGLTEVAGYVVNLIRQRIGQSGNPRLILIA
jgi:hypothetical protein